MLGYESLNVRVRISVCVIEAYFRLTSLEAYLEDEVVLQPEVLFIVNLYIVRLLVYYK